MKNKNLKQYYDDINYTLLRFKTEYLKIFNYKKNYDSNSIYSKKTFDDIIVYLTALREIIGLKLKLRGEKND